MPEGIRIDQITVGYAKEFHEKLKARGMATTTIHKRIQFARQFMHDAVDWKILEENPFLKVKTQGERGSCRAINAMVRQESHPL